MKLKKSLAPVINDRSIILILGSMPGEESLRRQEYYGYPQNVFWRLISAVLGVEAPEDYSGKLKMLDAGGIGLWDVIESCTREGSLDTMIRNETPNNFSELLKQYSGIKAVFFNGKKAAQSFKRRVGLNILEQAGIVHTVLPSSSPANTVGFEKKITEWKKIGEHLI